MKSIKNVQEVLTRKSFPDFMKALNHRVDIKEWSEVGGVFKIARNILQKKKFDIIFDIGCGKYPTLATMVALNIKSSEVIAIDPQLQLSESFDFIKRLDLIKDKLSDVSDLALTGSGLNGSALLLSNHSHATNKEIKRVTNLFKEWIYITVPCCVDNRLHGLKSIHIKDVHSHSPKNDVYICASSPALLCTILI